MDVLVDEANRALRCRGYRPDEAAVYAHESAVDLAVLRGSLVSETVEVKGQMLVLVSQFPERDLLVDALADNPA